MKIFRTYFTSYVTPYASKSEGVIYSGDREYFYLLDGEVRVTSSDEKSELRTPQEDVSGPFTRADFGSHDRLAWPAGACAVPQTARLRHWGKRFVMWTDDKETLFVVDATRPIVMELRIPNVVTRHYGDILFHGSRFWLDNFGMITSFAVSEIEALFDMPSGRHEVHVHETYPDRKPGRFEDANVMTVSASEATVHVVSLKRTISIPSVPGLQIGMKVKVWDLYRREGFCAIELPGEARRPMFELPPKTVVLATLAHEPALDPAGGLGIAPPVETTRTAELDRLFGALADDPDDDATRSVLVDLLEEAGEPYAPELAALRADTDPKARSQALGLLARFLFNIEWRNHLPYAATLAGSAPLEDWVCESAGTDRRLGFFRTLRIGEGPFAVYAKLVGAPRAVGLRHVDVPRVQVIQALIAAKRTRLTSLGKVRFTTRDVIEGLADPTFDRVVNIETETGAAVAAKFLEFILRDETKFWSRAPRHLILSERGGREDLLVPIVQAAWKNLPLAKLTVGDKTFER